MAVKNDGFIFWASKSDLPGCGFFLLVGSYTTVDKAVRQLACLEGGYED